MDWNKLIFIIQSFLLASVGKEKEEWKNVIYVFLFAEDWDDGRGGDSNYNYV